MGKKLQCIGRYGLDSVTLGRGNFAKVELATHDVTKIQVALKIIDTRKIKDEYMLSNLHREAKIMTNLRHPHIIRLYETLKATTLYCLVTEYVTGGDLLEYVKSKEDQKLEEAEGRTFVRQLISALVYIHSRNIVHRDLKMENILLDDDKKNLKLIDFGLSNTYKRQCPLKTHCGSPEYAAPELFHVGRTYGPEVDIWSVGIVTYAMLVGRLPFSDHFNEEFQRQKMMKQIQNGLSTGHKKEMKILSPNCRNLLHQLIEPRPELRIPLGEIQKHPWVDKNGKYPFVKFASYPRTSFLKNQVISELSYMSEIKKGVLVQIASENKSDEVSAMFNMMLDRKMKDNGFFGIDYTRKTCQPRDTSATPTSSNNSSGATKRPVAKTVAKKLKTTNKRFSRSGLGVVSSDTTTTHTKCLSTSELNGRSDRTGTTEWNELIFTSEPYPPDLPYRITPAPSVKLHMTLDLSVANYSCGLSPFPVNHHWRQCGSSFGVAASSGVPPCMSPVEGGEPKNTAPLEDSFISKRSRRSFLKRWKQRKTSSETILHHFSTTTTTNANDFKPSSKHNSTKRPSSLSISFRSKEVSVKPWVVAPIASPEDSPTTKDLADTYSGLSTDLNSLHHSPIIPTIHVYNDSSDNLHHLNNTPTPPPFAGVNNKCNDLTNESNDMSNGFNDLSNRCEGLNNKVNDLNNRCNDVNNKLNHSSETYSDLNNLDVPDETYVSLVQPVPSTNVHKDLCDESSAAGNHKADTHNDNSKRHTINLNHKDWTKVNYDFQQFSKPPNKPNHDATHNHTFYFHDNLPLHIDCQRVFQDTVTHNVKAPQLTKPKLTFRDLFTRRSKKQNHRSLSIHRSNKQPNPAPPFATTRPNKTAAHSFDFTNKQTSIKPPLHKNTSKVSTDAANRSLPADQANIKASNTTLSNRNYIKSYKSLVKIKNSSKSVDSRTNFETSSKNSDVLRNENLSNNFNKITFDNSTNIHDKNKNSKVTSSKHKQSFDINNNNQSETLDKSRSDEQRRGCNGLEGSRRNSRTAVCRKLWSASDKLSRGVELEGGDDPKRGSLKKERCPESCAQKSDPPITGTKEKHHRLNGSLKQKGVEDGRNRIKSSVKKVQWKN